MVYEGAIRVLSIRIHYIFNKYEIIPSHTLPADYFNEFFDRIYSECNDAKSIVNCFIGYLNKKLKRTTKDKFTVDLNDAVRYYFSQDKAMYHPMEECQELYHISIEKDTILDESTLPFYWQIIDNNAIMVHQLSKKFGGRIVESKQIALWLKMVIEWNVNKVLDSTEKR
jgi:hypothetical protein